MLSLQNMDLKTEEHFMQCKKRQAAIKEDSQLQTNILIVGLALEMRIYNMP